MRFSVGNVWLLILLTLLTLGYFSHPSTGMYVTLNMKLVSYFNFLLLVSALISIKQYFWPGDYDKLSYQVFHLLFAVGYYVISFHFLFTHKAIYEQYAGLTDKDIFNYFISCRDVFSVMFWVILSSVMINILYVLRFWSTFPGFA